MLKTRIISATVAIVILGANLSFGWFKLEKNPTQNNDSFRTRLVQIDVAQGKKWDKASLNNQIYKYILYLR